LRANIFIEFIFISFDIVTEDDTFLQFIFSRYNSKYTGPVMHKENFIVFYEMKTKTIYIK